MSELEFSPQSLTLESLCKEHGYKREKFHFPTGSVEIINTMDVKLNPEEVQQILKEQIRLIKDKSAKLNCMIVAAGAVLHGWADGVMTTYESKSTDTLVGSTNHAVAWKKSSHGYAAFDFTARDSFKVGDRPNVLVIVAEDKVELQKAIGNIYGNDGVNDTDEPGWGEQSAISVEKNQQKYIQFFGNAREKLRFKLKTVFSG